MVRTTLAALACLLSACAQVAERGADAPRRIVSLDYCADQYVLKFADREDILALSPDAGKRFSYMRAAAEGIPTVRPRTADVLALQPDLVVRTYGGGHDIADFMKEPGVPVVQIGFPQSIAEVRDEVLRVGTELGKPDEAEKLVADMDRRLKALAERSGPQREVLYMTPAGVTAGEGTLVHELFVAAGLRNFQNRPGWNPLPLERLAYDRPDVIAAAFFESKTNHVDNWSAARHPVARAQLRELPVVPLEGAWTSCGGWFLIDAVEALAEGKEGAQ
ncbi:iron ABC transporter substrate-binding protein [Erythrobacter sp. SAORIC-644]|jgi:iron complex transport system substrate-binding protein|uniref:ABC transporter substrate-binding protein n=1 Tax=Erythrobacteraceae TaxID=335929 RepID=UPI000C99157D|nr:MULTISPECIES: ABC transporter substrate-binding protein [Erythrobacteraceae]MAG42207.1 iron ABC transporter substrate-binding protein [Erythrobacteraceae bacterium]QPL39860.1 ABC transporter substrate-binding protein [Erythrobacter sp. A30-3]MBY8332682.1 ABC transporter substrate-binding protein [Qipengyuania pacifica]MCA0889221.1 ABC transporter substrate-binding protein [Qipengyuania flava]PNQ73198.1 iron ABC transporter substrate-binding protein [Erythrobacter sp. SAORIC-644]